MSVSNKFKRSTAAAIAIVTAVSAITPAFAGNTVNINEGENFGVAQAQLINNFDDGSFGRNLATSFFTGGFGALFGNKGSAYAPSTTGSICVDNSTDAESFLGIYSYSKGRDAIPGLPTSMTTPEFLKQDASVREAFVTKALENISKIEDEDKQDAEAKKLHSFLCTTNNFAIEMALLDAEGKIRKETFALLGYFGIWAEQQKHACNGYAIAGEPATFGHGKGGSHDAAHNNGVSTCDKNAKEAQNKIDAILALD